MTLAVDEAQAILIEITAGVEYPRWLDPICFMLVKSTASSCDHHTLGYFEHSL